MHAVLCTLPSLSIFESTNADTLDSKGLRTFLGKAISLKGWCMVVGGKGPVTTRNVLAC